MASFLSLCLLDQNHITEGECSGLMSTISYRILWEAALKREVLVLKS